MLESAIPDLTLRGLVLGPKQTPIDLRFLLYKGAASTFQRNVEKAIKAGKLGQPQLERLTLLVAMHEQLQVKISTKKSSDQTIRTYWSVIRSFVTFVDEVKKPLTMESVLGLYLAYCAKITRRSDLNADNQYSYSQVLASIIAPVLGMDGRKLQWKTKIRMPKRLGNKAAKENLESTAAFIQVLLETIEQLSVEVIRGPLPVTLRFIAGNEHAIHCGLPLKSVDDLKGKHSHFQREEEARRRRADDTSNRARAQLINLRIDAELLVFINQTGGNLTQALGLTGSKFRYQSEGDYLHVYAWKGRAKHSVNLKIHKAYRRHFEAYLKWRSSIFPDDPDGLTFPFVWNDGDKAMFRTTWGFAEARKLMKAIGQPFVHSRQLRNTAGNFMKRKVSRQAAAELLNNTEKTFRESYEEVHHQTATAELVSFWRDTEAVVAAVGPGGCEQVKPNPRADAPEGSPKPDCEGGAGCLFCDKNRDLRSFDHVWNLASLHHMKLAELNADRTPHSRSKNHPVAISVERISAKLDALMSLGNEFAEWVTEAKLRTAEGRYHPFYVEKFEILEGPR